MHHVPGMLANLTTADPSPNSEAESQVVDTIVAEIPTGTSSGISAAESQGNACTPVLCHIHH